MNIPVLSNVQFVQSNGYLTSAMQFYNDTLNQSLNNGLSDNGWTVPQRTTAQITAIEPNMPLGTLWFDTDIAKLKVKTATGVVETITSV